MLCEGVSIRQNDLSISCNNTSIRKGGGVFDCNTVSLKLGSTFVELMPVSPTFINQDVSLFSNRQNTRSTTAPACQA